MAKGLLMIAIEGITHVRYQSLQLDDMTRFFADFGLVFYESRDTERLYFRGAGTRPYVCILERGEPAFLGCGFAINSLEDLQALAEETHTSVKPVLAPGGGYEVCLVDPDGFIIEVLCGQDIVAPLPVREPLQFNSAFEKKRLGTFQRLAKGPAQSIKLGHIALNVRNFASSLHFLKSRI
jgi:catechol 2,3-dioxygenase-like lactoylglutathione lyase family enzyme